MGVQVIGERKRRKAERETGLQIDRLLRLDNHHWEARVLTPTGHKHFLIDRDTWETRPRPADVYGGCWTTCGRLPEQHRQRENEGDA